MSQSAASSLADPSVHGGEVFEVARQLRLDPEKVIDFSSSINPLGPPSSAIQRLKNAIRMIPHYPDISYYDLRAAAAEYVGLLAASNVIEGNGSTELIHLFTELSMKPGDKALIPVPAFGEYERAVRIRGGIPVPVACREDFAVDAEMVADELDRGCKVLFLSNPGNPSSRTTPKKELLRMIELASDRDVRVLLDETFVEFTGGNGEEISSRVQEFPNLLVIRSLTKIFALTGLRVGYGLASRELVSQLRRRKIPWSVNILAQEASIAALNDRAYVERSRKLIAKERNFLHSGLEGVRGLKPVRPEANYVLVKLSHGPTAKELRSVLLKKRILVRDCSSFEGLNESYFRVSVKLRKQNVMLLSALKEALDR